MPTIIARFTISDHLENPLSGISGGWAEGWIFHKNFYSGFHGSSEVYFVSSDTEEGNRAYIAAERLTGTFDDGRQGSLTVHHGGVESEPEKWFGYIVPGTGTADLTDLAGSARIQHDAEGAYFEIALTHRPPQPDTD